MVWVIIYLPGIIPMVIFILLSFHLDNRLEEVFPSWIEFAVERDILMQDYNPEWTISYEGGSIGKTTRELQELVERTPNGQVGLLTATSFLQSEQGCDFLRRVEYRLKHRLVIEEEAGSVERKRKIWPIVFMIILILAVHLSAGGAYRSPEPTKSTSKNAKVRKQCSRNAFI